MAVREVRGSGELWGAATVWGLRAYGVGAISLI